jgi:hypothetical protein
LTEDEPGGLRWRWDGLTLDAGTIAITQTFSKQRLAAESPGQ